MRLAIVLGVFALALAGCGKGEDKAPDVKPPSCFSASGCIKPPSMSIRTRSGQESISLTDITWVQVKVYKQIGPIGSTVDLRREFTGSDAIRVVTQFGLDAPRVNAPPQPGTSMTTGQLTINYKRSTDTVDQSKTLLIQNKQIILDYEYDDITYDPRKTFDRAWLEKQPQ